MKGFKILLLLFVLSINLLVGSVSSIKGCSRASSFKMSELFTADFIVRATAVKYIIPPDSPGQRSRVPYSTIEFKVEETIWGSDVPATISLNGYLSKEDDFNESPLPYKFVRPKGRYGNCFAIEYKEGAQFLLFVRKSSDWSLFHAPTVYTTNFSPLGPTNEQLRDADDPWVKWVKAYLNPCAKQDKNAVEFTSMSKDKMNAISKGQATDLDKYRLSKCYLSKYGTDGIEDRNRLTVVNSFEEEQIKP
jgi:hypothetical protein